MRMVTVMTEPSTFLVSVQTLWQYAADEPVLYTFDGPITLDEQRTVHAEGTVKLTKLADDEILAELALHALTPLACARCLRTFEHEMMLEANEVFNRFPEPEQFPISARLQIDLAAPIRQLIILNEPGFPLCQADCPGTMELS